MAVVALPMLTSLAPRRPRLLPSSIQKCKAMPIAKAVDQSTFQWTPVQKNRSEGPVNRSKGSFVTTLSVDCLTHTFEGATPYMVRVEKANFAPVQGGAVWCYLVGGTCVIMKGIVTGRRSSSARSARDNLIARLPEGLRPARALLFAALARDVFEDGARTVVSSSLATIIVTPDGAISKMCGGSAEASIDLSAIRFCTDRGISLVDEVSVHAVDIAGSRLVTLQGVLLEKSWHNAKKQLATLPESCRPAKDLHFIVPGISREGYHLVQVKPMSGAGKEGEIVWKDSIWIRDRINLTGVIFEVSQDSCKSHLYKSMQEVEVTKQGLLLDLHRRIVKKYGCIEYGLKKAFCINEEGELNFSQFVSGTKLLGYHGHMTRLWALLDEDQGGSVSYEEFVHAVETMLDQQAVAAAMHTSPRSASKPQPIEDQATTISDGGGTPRAPAALPEIDATLRSPLSART